MAYAFPPCGFGYCPVEFVKESFLIARVPRRLKGGAVPAPNVMCMLLCQCPLETSHHKVMIGVVSRVPDRYILVQIEVRPHEVIDDRVQASLRNKSYI